MNIIIAGDGDVGFYLARMLSIEKHNITIIDPHENLLRKVENSSDLMALAGNSTSIEVLENAEVRKADLLISVLKDERQNIITAILGKKLGAKRTIARINNPEYLKEENRKMFLTLGIDTMVCPERIASLEIVKLLRQPAATEFYEFSEGKLVLILLKLDSHSLVLGKSLDEIAKEYIRLDYRCVAIHRNSKIIFPRGHDVFQVNDLVYVVSRPQGMDELLRLAGKKQASIKNVMIVGAGRIGRKTAALIQSNFNVKLIELARERSISSAATLSKTLVINGDARNIELIEEEGIGKMDAFLALTNDTETNIFSCLLASRYGVPRTIALVENVEFIDISQRIGVETIINKKILTASYIARFTLGPQVSSTRCLIGIDAEAVEFIAKHASRVTKKPIRNLGLPDECVIAGIVRNGKAFIAVGDFQIQENDRVLVVVLPESIKAIQKFFN